MIPRARLAEAEDLAQLSDLFWNSKVSSLASDDRLPEIWSEILARPGTDVFVAESDGRIVATAMLVTAPNLLRAGRGHAFLENVVTHPDFQGKGFGQAVVVAALERAWEQDCHHVLLQSGRPDVRVHVFYEKLGFRPGLRNAYCAPNPSG